MDKKKFNFIPSFATAAPTVTENGALSYATTGSEMADQFGKAANYRGREIADVFSDQENLWKSSPIMALRFPFYLRMITRKVKVNDDSLTERVQKGQGVRDESFKRLLWIAANEPDSFYKNIWVLPMVGSWKDLWVMLFYDRKFGINTLNHEIIFDLINEGLKTKAHSELIKKFMPRIRSNSKCTTDWTKAINDFAKEFANYNKLSYRDYNHLKTSGTAHDFQKLICSGRFKDINWNLVPGRALTQLSSEKFLKGHDLEKNYTDWVMAQPTAKFTGYVYELFKQLVNAHQIDKMPIYKRITIDKQFDELVRKATEDGNVLGNVWCALDTSGSMTWSSPTLNGITAFDICVSLGIFLSTLNRGAFHKNVVMFDDTSTIKKLEGTFSEMARQIITSTTAWGSTNFQSIIDLMIKVRRENGSIPIEDYPDTILVVSDMQFNVPSDARETNFENAKRRLKEVFPEEYVENLKWIWWQVTDRTKDVPATVGPGQMFLSGFDASIITLLLGGEAKEYEQEKGRPLTTEESIALALSQEILTYVTV